MLTFRATFTENESSGDESIYQLTVRSVYENIGLVFFLESLLTSLAARSIYINMQKKRKIARPIFLQHEPRASAYLYIS